MRSRHDNSALKRATAASQTEKERERDTAEISGVFASPQTWSPTFRLTFPRLQLGIVLGLSWHTKLWMKKGI